MAEIAADRSYEAPVYHVLCRLASVSIDLGSLRRPSSNDIVNVDATLWCQRLAHVHRTNILLSCFFRCLAIVAQSIAMNHSVDEAWREMLNLTEAKRKERKRNKFQPFFDSQFKRKTLVAKWRRKKMQLSIAANEKNPFFNWATSVDGEFNFWNAGITISNWMTGIPIVPVKAFSLAAE